MRPDSIASSSDHYDSRRASHYEAHHTERLRTRLTTWRERQCLRHALRDAGRPPRALDLPCGTGRFWPAFERAGVRELIAADGSAAMVEIAGGHRTAAGLPQRLLQCSAFDIPLADGSVDFAACLRFYHHLGRPADRQALLAELGRVSTRYVAISLWVDGSLAGRNRLRRPQPEAISGYGKRRCRRRGELPAEFAAAGLRIVRHYDVWPRIAMWRLYLLEHANP